MWPDPTAVKARIGVQLQATALFDYLRLHEIIHLFGSCYGVRRTPREIDALLDRVGLLEKRDSFADQLSGGQAQRLSIALALVNDPVVTFLDEPTTGLDPRARRALWDVIRAINEAGTTVVLTTHYMEEAERLCDRVAVMDHGRVMALDTPRALVHDLGADAHVTLHAQRAAPAGRALRSRRRVELLGPRGRGLRGGRGRRAAGRRSRCSTWPLPAASTVENLDVQGANLEDVFLRMTGRKLAEEEEDDEAAERPQKPRRRGLFFGGGGR